MAHDFVRMAPDASGVEGALRLESKDDQVGVVLLREREHRVGGIAGEPFAAQKAVFVAGCQCVKVISQFFKSRCVGPLRMRTDVNDVEVGVPLTLNRENPWQCRKAFGGQIGGEEHVLQLQMLPGTGGVRSDDCDRASDCMKNLLGD